MNFCSHFNNSTVRVKFLLQNLQLRQKNTVKESLKSERLSSAGNFCKMDYRSKLLVSGKPAHTQLVCTRMLICNSPMNTKDIPEDWKKDNTMPVLKKTKQANPHNYRAVNSPKKTIE